MVSSSDAELVGRARTGDLAAFGELIARYRPRLGRYAVHLLGSREDAEEALQDSLVRAYRGLDRCGQPERFGAWLFTILVNRCRTRRGRRDLVDRSQDAEAAYRAASVRADDAAIEWNDEIQRALRRLPADQREAFLLRHVEELSYEEIARMTGARIPALKMRVSRACERLRADLKELYHG